MKKSLLLLILFFPLLTNCLPSVISTTTPHAEITQITNESPITPAPMEINEADAPESTLVPENGSGIIQLPEWLRSPGGSEIFIANGCPSKENCQLIFVNPDKQASYNLLVNDIAVYFWLPEGKGIGLITHHQQFINIDLATGEMTSTTLSAQSLRFFPDALPSEYPRPAYAFGDVNSSEWFVVANPKDFSSDHRHRILQDFSKEEFPLSVEYLDSGDAIKVTQENDGIFDVEYAWSPDSSKLAILQSAVPAMPALPGQVLYDDTRIILFDANQKRITKNFEGDFAYINWSPDGRYILYQTPLADGQGNSPEACVLDVQIDRRRCFGTIANQTIDAYNNDYEWLPDSSGLVYLKQANSEEYNHFCIYKFQEDRVNCPSQDISQINNRKIFQYSLSPDGRFVFLTSDTAYSSFDAPDRPISAWMQADGQVYSELWGEDDFQTFGWNPAAVGVIWRPAVQWTGSIIASPVAPSQPLNNPGWQLYLNRKHLFTLEFPPGWLVLETPTLVYPTAQEGIWFDHAAFPPPQTDARPDISLYILESDPTQDWRAEYFNDFKSSEIQIGQIPAIRISGINKETLAREDTIIVCLDTFYILAYASQSAEAEQYFDRILATFRRIPANTFPVQEQVTPAPTHLETSLPPPPEPIITVVSPLPTCQDYSSKVDISTPNQSVTVGDQVEVIVTFQNMGCATLGLLKYYLLFETLTDEPVLTPAQPAPVEHPLAVQPDGSDQVVYSFQAVRAGIVKLSATISFEAHLGYPGPAYWVTSSSNQLEIEVK